MPALTRILAAVDFGEASVGALSFAARLSRRLHAELHILHVVHPLLAAAGAEDGIDVPSQTLKSLEAFSRAVPDMRPDARHHVVTGLPSDTIMHVADREGADLIVTGSRGVALPERIAFGSTTERLLRQSNTSILVVPEAITQRVGASRMHIGPIVMGLECTGGAADAARAAQHLASVLGTDLRFVHAVADIKTSPQWSTLVSRALGRRCDAARHELTTLLEGLSLDQARLDVRIGSVPHVLAEAISGEPDALLVLGRCYGAPGHAGCAAMARRMLTLAAVPVLMHVTPA